MSTILAIAIPFVLLVAAVITLSVLLTKKSKPDCPDCCPAIGECSQPGTKNQCGQDFDCPERKCAPGMYCTNENTCKMIP